MQSASTDENRIIRRVVGVTCLMQIGSTVATRNSLLFVNHDFMVIDKNCLTKRAGVDQARLVYF